MTCPARRINSAGEPAPPRRGTPPRASADGNGSGTSLANANAIAQSAALPFRCERRARAQPFCGTEQCEPGHLDPPTDWLMSGSSGW